MKRIFLLVGAFTCFILNSLAQHSNIVISSNYSPNETSICIDPKNPARIIAAANLDNYYYSVDSGRTWTEGKLTSTYGVWGDPIVLVDTAGTYYFFHLSNYTQGTWIDRMVVQKSTNGGQTWSSGTFFGLNGTKKQDKHGVALNPATNEIAVTWTQFDNYGTNNPSDSSNILFSKSSDGGTTWTNPIRINQQAGDCVDSSLTVEGAVPTFGLNGEIFIAWSGPSGIVFDKSLDGGVTWMQTDKVIVPGHSWTFDVPGIYRCNGMPVTATDLSNSAHRGNIYINYADQSNGKFDTDIWLVRSTDGGNTWNAPVRVNNDPPGKHQFFTWMTVDQTTGYIWVVYYDRRNYTDELTDVYMALSTDGGLTFRNFKVSNAPFKPTNSVFFGDYTSVSAVNNVVRPIWTRLDMGALSAMTAIVDTRQVLTGIEPMPGVQNEQLSVDSYPNPFKDEVFISFKVRRTAKVTLKIYDQTGKSLATLINHESKEPGKYIIPFNAMNYNIAPGMYYYILEIEGQTAKRKLLYIK